jgi:hypothetical protein
MSKNKGGPAFPSHERKVFKDAHRGWKEEFRPASGMTLRDYFAAKAMGAYVNSELLISSNTEEECVLQFINVAAFSYQIADAMLAERDK